MYGVIAVGVVRAQVITAEKGVHTQADRPAILGELVRGVLPGMFEGDERVEPHQNPATRRQEAAHDGEHRAFAARSAQDHDVADADDEVVAGGIAVGGQRSDRQRLHAFLQEREAGVRRGRLLQKLRIEIDGHHLVPASLQRRGNATHPAARVENARTARKQRVGQASFAIDILACVQELGETRTIAARRRGHLPPSQFGHPRSLTAVGHPRVSTVLDAVAVLLGMSAFFTWLNERTVRLPSTVGVALAGAASATLLLVLDQLGVVGPRLGAATLLERLDFPQFFLGGILSLLLFAGALGMDSRQVMRQKASIGVLALFSTLISTALIGGAAHLVLRAFGFEVPLLYSFLFGAMISPTDPVAVLDMLKRGRVPTRLQTLIAGESLFNDGVGIVIFLVISALAGLGSEHHVDPTVLGALGLFLQEAGGGLLLGAVIGFIGMTLTRTIEAHSAEVLLTIAMVACGYALAFRLGVSGPIAMVMAGLVMSYYKEVVFSPATRELVEGFWEVIDEVLNVILFAFLGLDLLLIRPSAGLVGASLVLIVVALGARFLSLGLPMIWIKRAEGFGSGTTRLLTWAGLRGGIAIGLALGLPDSPYRDVLLVPTFIIVLFTVAVQGLTVMPLVRRADVGDVPAGSASS